MLKLSDKTKLDIKNELRSIFTTFISEFSFEIGIFLLAVSNGSATEAMLLALGSAAFRSLVKAVGVKYFPAAFKYEVKGIAKIK